MKLAGLLFLVCIAMFSCKPQPTVQAGAKGITNPPGSASHHPVMQASQITGRVMHTSSYCDGAAPTEEILAEKAIAKPLVGVTLHARQGNTNPLSDSTFQTAVTDENGNYTFELPPGEWCIVTADKAHAGPVPGNTANTVVDATCYEKWRATCDLTVNVKVSSKSASEKVKVADIVRHKACFVDFQPCTQYTGPLPASAPPRER